MKRVILITGTVIILVFFSGMHYLMQTEAGLKWLIQRAVHAVSGLSITSAQGRLSGPIQIRGIQYKSGDSSYSIDEFVLDWKLSRLMYLEAHISTLNIQGVTIINAGQTTATEPASELPEVNFPLKIVVKRAEISNISIMQSIESRPVTIHTVSLKGRAGPKTIRINKFYIDMPELTLTANGKISPQGNYPMDIALSWNVRIPEFEEISGNGNIAGTFTLLKITQEITSPAHSKANLNISDIINNLTWEGDISVREFDMVKLNRTWPDINLAGDIRGQGSATNADISSLFVRISDGQVTGSGSVSWQPDITWTLNFNAERLNPGILWPEWQGALAVTARSAGQYEKEALTITPSEVSVEGLLRDRPLQAHAKLSVTGSQLELTTLEVSSGASHISASGKLADTLSLHWETHIQDAGGLVPQLKGEISGSGSVAGTRSYPVLKGTINGSTVSYDTYSAESIKAVVDIDTKDERGSLIDIQAENVILSGKGIEKFSLKGSGMVSSHTISMYAAKDNLNIDILAKGGYSDETWSGKFNSADINSVTFGRWNLQEPAVFFVSKDKAGSDLLCLVSNGAQLCIQTSWDITAGVKGKLSLTEFPLSMAKTFLPAMVTTDGTLNGDGYISYAPEGMMSGNISLIIPSGKLQYQADNQPVDISIGKSQVDIMLSETALDAHADIVFPDRGHIKGEINLPGFMPGITDTADQQIIGHVTAELNNLDLIPVFAPQVSKASGVVAARIQMNGTFAETAITGGMILQEGTVELPELGLKLKGINLALKGDEKRTVIIDGWISSIRADLPSSVNIESSINWEGNISYTPEGTMSGSLSLITPSGKLQYQADDKSVDISIGKSQVDIMLSETALDAHADIVFPDRGHIKGEINLPGFMPGITDTADQQIIGHIAAELNKIDLISVFVPTVNNVSGAVTAHMQMNGTFAETILTGDVTLREGAADIYDLGLQLRDINLALKGDEKQTVTIEGRLSSGKGHMAVNGTVGLYNQKAPSAVIRIQGENVEVIKIPGTWIIASPDIDLRIEDNIINFAGSMAIPQALLEPPDISGSVLPSKDVIVADMPVDKKEKVWSQTGKFKLTLGDNVRFKGYGLTCRITGGIDITEQPGKLTQGHGEFQVIEGKYKAYGQDLAIEKGRLLFAGLLDDPGLDIRAFRTIKDVTAGVNVQGTLKSPEFYVYSKPSMDESDALSYVLFGRPMTQLSGSEGSKLHGAALSAGLSAGGFAAKKIGAAFGVEDVEIANGDEPEQATLFIGKYLSPRLYLSYGIGLFEPVSTIRLRYDLTRSLEVQTEYGLESGGDVLYTIER